MYRAISLALALCCLVACSAEWEDTRDLDSPEPPAFGLLDVEPAPGPGTVRQLMDSDALLDGVTFDAPHAVRSLWVVFAGEPDALVEVRASGQEGWTEVLFTEDLGWHRNGPVYLDGPTDAVELRTDGICDFVQVELFEADEVWFDDPIVERPAEQDEGAEASMHEGEGPEPDSDHGVEGPERASIDGMWDMPDDVWATAQQWDVPYEYAYGASGGLTPGARQLAEFLVESFDGAVSWEGYNPRFIGNDPAKGWSVHATGRAIDVFVPLYGGDADNDLGDPIANYLAVNAEDIGITYFIWDRAEWLASAAGNKHRSYYGDDAHINHLHIELSTPGGQMTTPWFTDGPVPPEGGLNDVIDLAATPSGDGYWTVTADGLVSAHGAAEHHGDARDIDLVAPIWGISSTPSGDGYWLVALDGGTFCFGDAQPFGSMGGEHLVAPVVDLVPTPSGDGYWLTAMDGGVFSFGDAGFHGSAADLDLVRPVVGIAATPSGDGYWLAAADGGVFCFGDAEFYGSMADEHMVAEVVDIAARPDGRGYWLVGADGGVFTFGDAGFHGSMADEELVAPVIGVSSTPSGDGYWQVALDGGVFTFGDADFYGSDTE